MCVWGGRGVCVCFIFHKQENYCIRWVRLKVKYYSSLEGYPLYLINSAQPISLSLQYVRAGIRNGEKSYKVKR